MAEDKRDQKRPAVKARKADMKMNKGVRRKQRSGSAGSRPESIAYGDRSLAKPPQGSGISITVNFPSFRRSKNVAHSRGPTQIPRKKRQLWPVLAIPALAVVGMAVYYGPFMKDQSKPVQTAAAADRSAPDYQLLVPSAEKAATTVYDGKRNLVSYNSTFSGVRLTVSQQALPDNFTKDPTAIMKAADSIKAAQQIQTNRGMLYVATNEPGDQLAVFADKSVLVFVHSDKKLDEFSWKSFIEQLEAASWETVKS